MYIINNYVLNYIFRSMQSSQQTWMDSAINFLDLLNDNSYTSRIFF